MKIHKLETSTTIENDAKYVIFKIPLQNREETKKAKQTIKQTMGACILGSTDMSK